jgi:hypothetical protein
METRERVFYGDPWRTSSKRRFSADEDAMLTTLHNVLGKDWKAISEKMGGRSARQCRERYKNYLDPSRSNKVWTSDEDAILLEKGSQRGANWASFTSILPGRTRIDMRNRWGFLSQRRRWHKPKRNPEGGDESEECYNQFSNIE